MNKKKLLLATGVLSILNVNAFAVDVTTGNGSGIAYGTNSIANENNSIAVGQNAKATNISSVAIGLDAKAIGFNSIAIGMSTSSHPSVNYGPVIAKGTNSIAVGYGAQANHDETVVIGANTATISTKDQYGIDTNPMYSTVIGYGSKSTNQAATVVGYNSTGSGWNSIVLGNFVDSTGQDSIGIGYGAKSYNENSVAIGKSSEASEYNSMAIGSYAIASKNLSVAIGNNATANNENSVALGSISNTDEAVVTTSAIIGNKKYNFASPNVLGTVSVGGKIASDYEKEADGSPKYNTDGQPIYIYDQITRTVTNVAAGRINEKSTDAVNGSQLHAVITEVNNNKVNAGKNIEINNGSVSLKNDVSGLHSIELNTHPDGTSVTINDNTIMVRNPMNSFTEMDYLTTITSGSVEVEGTNFRNTLAEEGLQINSNDVANSFTYDGIHLANRYDQSLDFSFDNVNVGGNQIHNVKAGTELTDAVNVSQLKEVENKINNINNIAINQANHYTDLQINKGVAKASALAGLKYLDYNPKDKWSFAASVGHYRNANAVAVGMAYQPNENTMVHGGITVDGKVAYNLGVSIKTGGQKYINKYDLQDQIKQLQSDNAELRQELAELRSMVEKR